MKRIRVLAVDDSPTALGLLTASVEHCSDIEVVGTAVNAFAARQAIKELNPDVLTLDVEMPEMDGLEFLRRIMRLRPMPVIMVSSLTTKGSDTAIEALQIGAIECIAKPTASDPYSFDAIAEKIRIAAQANVFARLLSQPTATSHLVRPAAFVPGPKIVAIGASTGGVEALVTVLRSLPANCAPTLITQHIPAHITGSLVRRLANNCAARVVEARNGLPLETGHVYLAPGGDAHLEIFGESHLCCRLRRSDPVNGHCPSVDVLFNSVARCAGREAVGVILTGMGRDGASGLLAMREKGARTLGQDHASSIVYGMPKAAFELGAVGTQLPLAKIGDEIVRLTAAPAH